MSDTTRAQAGSIRAAAGLRIAVFGPLFIDNTPDLTRGSHRRLLAILLLDGGKRMPLDLLIDRFWTNGPPRSAKGAIHTHVSALRRVLPHDLITTDHGGYFIDVDRVHLDRDAFVDITKSAHALARVQRWGDVVAATEQALGIWIGEPFADLAGDGFAEPEINRLREFRLQAIELRAEALLRLGRAREAIADLEWATRSFPLRESLCTLLAVARQETGAHADALRSLRATEAALAELGLDPSPALRALEQQILTHRQHPTVRAIDPPVDRLRSA